MGLNATTSSELLTRFAQKRSSAYTVQIKQAEEYEPGQQLKLEEVFKVGDLVDVAGTSIGKGFQGISHLPLPLG